MAHEVDKSVGQKRELDMRNGRPVDAETRDEGESDADTDTDTEEDTDDESA